MQDGHDAGRVHLEMVLLRRAAPVWDHFIQPAWHFLSAHKIQKARRRDESMCDGGWRDV